ncbi:MAG TPA: S8 family serine peptidase, partial [Verrucomicrobiae bacterium]|nr:S8 family serine peptidase [Verrucomicrobiae bacterium]
MRLPRFWALGLAWGLMVVAARAGEFTVTNPPATFEFRHPRRAAYVVESSPLTLQSTETRQQWVRARPASGSTNIVEFGSRVVLQLQPGADLGATLGKTSLRVSRQLAEGVWILQAPNARIALEEAARLAKLPQVLVCHPVSRRHIASTNRYAPAPDDPYFNQQWHLENRDSLTGARAGVDINARAAWAVTDGAGIQIAQGDDGVDITHPDLARALTGSPHFNFDTRLADGRHPTSAADHGTGVAGVLAAEANNHRGVTGVAPGAKLASWVIFTPGGSSIDDESMMQMFQYQSNVVAVQNHSWANVYDEQLDVSLVERMGITNAVINGRDGRGEVLVWASGNGRDNYQNANDSAYTANPLGIAVGAARFDGRVASYSNPGACILLGAPGGDWDEDSPGIPSVFSTDRQGRLGENTATYTNDLADYMFGDTGFVGTSAASPQIAGIAALILSVNTNLSYRDAQQILAHSARHWDLADPDLQTNGAGFLVGHNLGFGVPDAGQAIRLAQIWPNRPPLVSTSVKVSNYTIIPDDGLRVVVSGPATPTNLLSLGASPGDGLQFLAPTANLPVV